MPMKDFKQHFWMLHSNLVTKKPFAFSRFSDGEMFIMQNKKLVINAKGRRDTVDHKDFDPAKHGAVRDRLIEAYKFQKKNYYVGLSCKCCVGDANFKWMVDLRGQDDEYLTWANLLINSNYPLFVEHFIPAFSNRKMVIVCNENAKVEKLPFPVEKAFYVGYNAMVNDLGVIDELKDYFRDKQDFCLLCSASSLSEIIIYDLFKAFPSNTYMDIGTGLNHVLDMPIARGYLQAYFGIHPNIPTIRRTCIW